MRWKLPEPPPETPHGTKRNRKVFAFFPHTATDGYTYWLEWIFSAEVYSGSWHEWWRVEYVSSRSK